MEIDKQVVVAARRSVITDSELSDTEEEYQRWRRRLSGQEDGKPEHSANFLAEYASVLIRAIKAMESDSKDDL